MELNNVNNAEGSNVNEFDMDKVKEMVRLSNLEDMDSYDSDTKILEFFKKAFSNDKALDEGIVTVKEMVDNFIEQSFLEEDYYQEESKISMYKLYPFYDIKDKMTIKIIYLSIKYFYKNQLESSYELYQNPNHVKICLTFDEE